MLSTSLFEALAVALVPIVPLILPGVFLTNLYANTGFLLRGAQILAVSLTFGTLVSFVLVLLGLGVGWLPVAIIVAAGTGAWLGRRRILAWNNRWHIVSMVLLLVCGYALFSVPFLLQQDGLPTGDSQKAIFWAQEILTTHALPDYQRSLRHLNRDPVDFYTPGLHGLTAAIMRWSPQPLTSVGLFSIAMGLAVAWLGAALTQELLPEKKYRYAPVLAAALVLTQLRFLRYLREPGYHYQNLLGEFFLFALVLFTVRLLKAWRWSDAVLAGASAAALLITHQFSAFIGAFLGLVLASALIVRYSASIRAYLWHHLAAAAALGIIIVMSSAAAVWLGLHEKLPHLFTTDPHLISLVPSIADYFSLMGAGWLAAGMCGLIFMLSYAREHRGQALQIQTFVALTVTLLFLSQGPRLFIDIPPVRALFYTALPLSIAAAFLFVHIRHSIRKHTRGFVQIFLLASWITFLILPAFQSTRAAFTSTSRAVRTNSTLGAEQVPLIEHVAAAAASPPEGILIDDYNRRSTSWLLLSDQPMYARIAADLERQMEESRQSQTRYELYLRQLDYEKMFSLGSRPELVHLMRKHNIRWLVGIEGSSQSSLQYNPSLMATAYGDNAAIFEASEEAPACGADSACSWLLRASTLVNDIGDREDTFEHLPASLRATRVSDPLVLGADTYRTTSAPYIPLSFNVGDYVRVLWDKENTGRPDTTLEFYIVLQQAPPQNLAVITPAGKEFPITTTEAMIRIPAGDMPFNEKGFAQLTLHNPTGEPVAIDIVALGLARIP